MISRICAICEVQIVPGTILVHSHRAKVTYRPYSRFHVRGIGLFPESKMAIIMGIYCVQACRHHVHDVVPFACFATVLIDLFAICRHRTLSNRGL